MKRTRRTTSSARSRRLGIGLLCLAMTLIVSGVAFGFADSGDAGIQEKDKKQRGKTVRATLVPSSPAEEPSEDTESEAEEAEAEAEDAESSVDPKAAKKARKAEERAAKKSAREEQKEREASAEATEASARRSSSTSEPSASAGGNARSQATSVPVSPAAERPEAAPARATTTPRTTPATRTPVASSAATADPPRRSVAPPTRPRDVVRDNVVVREVLLDVLVNNKDGSPITGLGPEDFTVIENGERREVTSATLYGGPEFSGSGRDGETRSDRYFILMFHDQARFNPQLTSSQLDAGRWATRWLEDGMLPNDQIAVVGYTARLTLYQDFTRDRQKIADAILKASRGAKDLDRWTTRSDPTFDPNSPSLFVNLPTGKALSKQTPRLQKALELLGNAAEGIAGRKNLVLFSLGFGETRGQFGGFVPDPRYYPPMEQALNNGNVAVYTLNTLGATRGGNSIIGITDSLSSISNDTGGHYYSNFINVKTPLNQVAEDNQAYYLISYRTEYDVGDAGYREVEVEVSDPDARVRSRNGYLYGDAAPE